MSHWKANDTNRRYFVPYAKRPVCIEKSWEHTVASVGWVKTVKYISDCWVSGVSRTFMIFSISKGFSLQKQLQPDLLVWG